MMLISDWTVTNDSGDGIWAVTDSRPRHSLVRTIHCTYTVQPGDTLTAIARRYDATVTELAVMNGIRNPNLIRVGQVLVVK